MIMCCVFVNSDSVLSKTQQSIAAVAPELPLGTGGHVPPPLWEMAEHGRAQKEPQSERR